MVSEMENVFERYPVLTECKNETEKAIASIVNGYKNGGKVLCCGNGGSAADCDHIVGELMKGFLSLRPLDESEKKTLEALNASDMANCLQRGIPAISLSAQSGVLSAFANDVAPENVYAQLMFAYASYSDTAICISTSGNSKNVVNAAIAAKAKGACVVALTGKNKCRLDEIADIAIHVPETETYKVQELHLPIYHYICAETERILFG